MKRSMTMVVVCAAGAAVCATAAAHPADKKGPRARGPVVGGHTDAYPFSDNFDSYALGGLAGNGSWQLWAAGSVDGQVSNTQSTSPSNSFKTVPQTDIVQVGDVGTGIWELKCKTFYPSTNVAIGANDGPFIIGLNRWNLAAPGGATADYSAQIQWQKSTGNVRNYNLATQATPIVPDQWVEFRMVINLGTDKYDAYYNGIKFIDQRGWSTGVATTGGQVRIQSFDFYNGTAVTSPNDTFYMDDVSFAQMPAPCYANCDGTTIPPILNVSDFICFQTKYAAGDPYANCDNSTIPPILNVSDFICFQTKYSAGCS